MGNQQSTTSPTLGAAPASDGSSYGSERPIGASGGSAELSVAEKPRQKRRGSAELSARLLVAESPEAATAVVNEWLGRLPGGERGCALAEVHKILNVTSAKGATGAGADSPLLDVGVVRVAAGAAGGANGLQHVLQKLSAAGVSFTE